MKETIWLTKNATSDGPFEDIYQHDRVLRKPLALPKSLDRMNTRTHRLRLKQDPLALVRQKTGKHKVPDM